MYKKIICMLLSLILALSISACCCIPSSGVDYAPDTTSAYEDEAEAMKPTEAVSTATYIPGKIYGNTYRSSWLGIQFSLPHNMEFEDQVTHDRYNLVQIEQNPNNYTVEDLTVYYKFDSSSAITISLTKLAPGESSLSKLTRDWKADIKKTYREAEKQYSIQQDIYWYSDTEVDFLDDPYKIDDAYTLLSHYVGKDGKYTYYYDYFKIHEGFLVHIMFRMPGTTSTMTRTEFEPLFSKYTE